MYNAITEAKGSHFDKIRKKGDVAIYIQILRNNFGLILERE